MEENNDTAMSLCTRTNVVIFLHNFESLEGLSIEDAISTGSARYPHKSPHADKLLGPLLGPKVENRTFISECVQDPLGTRQHCRKPFHD